MFTIQWTLRSSLHSHHILSGVHCGKRVCRSKGVISFSRGSHAKLLLVSVVDVIEISRLWLCLCMFHSDGTHQGRATCLHGSILHLFEAQDPKLQGLIPIGSFSGFLTII